ncbi:hypothetical protein BD770DRAFT_396891 [Pilaira anomala]|nr:hypothetical protein BD770DRAFT_396891 [Pilaira anomala]
MYARFARPFLLFLSLPSPTLSARILPTNSGAAILSSFSLRHSNFMIFLFRTGKSSIPVNEVTAFHPTFLLSLSCNNCIESFFLKSRKVCLASI